MSEAVIIGAGPAGLTAGYELDKLGMHSIILEADSQAGGISRTANYKGYRFDIGGHRFFTKVPYIRQLWEEILADELLVRPRLSRIHYRGHFFDYPLKALNALAGLGPVESLLVILSYAKSKFFPQKDEDNFEQWVSNRFGYRLYHIFFKNYTEKVWGIPCTEISADWAAQRIKNLSLTEAVRNALFRNGTSKDGKVITTLIEQFYYPRRGPGMMWEECEKILADRGNQTLYNMEVVKIRHKNGRVESVYAKNKEGEYTKFNGEQFISSMPLRELVFALDPPPSDEVLEAANRLRYRDYLTVVLIVDRKQVFPDNWIYIHTPEVRMGRIQNYKNWSPEMVPDPNKTSLGLEYFLWDEDDEWNWPNDRLIELGIRECAKLELIERGEVSDGTVVRMRKAYPIYDQYYHDTLEVLKNYINQFDNLQTIGRNGLHRYNNQDHSMLTAVYAAHNIFGEAYDVWSVNTEMDYHEEDERIKTVTGDRMIPTRVPEKEKEPEVSFDEVVEQAFAPLDPFALGTAIGVVSGLGIFLATAFLLLKGGDIIGPTLSLLGNYFIGFQASWEGAFIGFGEAGLGGFVLGNIIARMRNWGMSAYALLIRRRAEARENKDLLDKV